MTAVEIAIIIGAIAISVLVFTWLLRVVKATIRAALLVAIILLILQIAFGIGPDTLWEQGLKQVWEVIQDWLPIRAIREFFSLARQ